MVPRLAALAATLALIVGIATPANALPIAPVPGTDVSVVSATNYVVPDQFEADKALADFSCFDAYPLPARSASLEIALGRADKVLAANESAATLRTFTASGIYRSAPQLEAAFALAMLNAKPGGALAASLRLARLKSDPRYLINAAVLLVRYDAPDVAYDLLLWAKDKPLGIMAGVDGTAAWQSAMGGVLLAYGQYAQAEAAYQAALARDPLMATARQGMARALKCLGDEEQASLWQGRSQTVIDPGPRLSTQPGEDGNPPTWTAPGLTSLIDLRNGKKAPAFGKFVPPPSPNIPKGGYTQYVVKDWSELNEKVANGIPTPPMDYLQEQYLDYISNVVQTDPVIIALDQESADLVEELADIASDSTCAAVDHFDRYWAWIGKNYEVTRRSAERVYLIYTAAAAYTGDPAFNAYLNDYAAYFVDAMYTSFLFGLLAYSGEAENHAQYVRDKDANPEYQDSLCKSTFQGQQPQTKYTPAGPKGTGERTSPCTALGSLAKKDLVTIDLPIPGSPIKPKIKINCERISLSAKFASVGGPYVDMGLFASADYNWFDNEFVLYAGAFGELGSLGVKGGPSLRLGYDANGDFMVKDFSFVVKTPLSGLQSIERARRQVGTTWLLVS